MKSAYNHNGFSIIGAIFVLVILSLLGLAMLTISAVLQTTSAQSINGTRAYYAATSGLEWAVYRATWMCQIDHDAICDNPATTTNFTIDGYDVTVVCDDYGTTFSSGLPAPFDIFDLDSITVTARKNVPVGSPDQVSRTIRASVTRGQQTPC